MRKKKGCFWRLLGERVGDWVRCVGFGGMGIVRKIMRK